VAHKKKRVYLGGAIHGLTENEASIWRMHATEALEAVGYAVLDPMRHGITDDLGINVVDLDLADIYRSEILLVEMDHTDCHYIGTCMEIQNAWENEKEIIVWGDANWGHPWIKHHMTKQFVLFKDALEYLVDKAERESEAV